MTFFSPSDEEIWSQDIMIAWWYEVYYGEPSSWSVVSLDVSTVLSLLEWALDEDVRLRDKEKLVELLVQRL